MKKKYSISDIAKELGISSTTVSFVLNGKAKEKRISESLAIKVLDFVEQVGYKPNELAKSLRTGKTKIIGLIIEDISNAFFANIARYIEYAAYGKGYRIIYCSTDNNPQKALELIQMFRDQHVDGFIITPTPNLTDVIVELTEQGVPLILFDRHLPEVETDYVITNNYEGAYEATRHLIAQGFSKIGFVVVAFGQSQMQERMRGYKQACDENGIAYSICEIPHGVGDPKAVSLFLEFYDHGKHDAYLFANNYLGVIAIRAFRNRDVQIPGMVSFDDHTLFRLFDPTISVVSQPISTIAEELIRILLEKLDGRETGTKQIILPSELIVRESSLARHQR